MANQIIIDIGAAANDGTGDPLRTAFNYVNSNFSNVWNTGLLTSNVSFSGNRILTVNTNGNLILAPNGVGKVVANVDIVPNMNTAHSLGALDRRWNTVYTQYLDVTGDIDFAGDVTVSGNLTVEGDTIQIGNIVTDTKTIQLSNTAVTANAANGSGVTVGANDNIATILYSSSGNVWTTNIGISAVGNITAPYFVGNGALLTGITTFANANAVAYGQAGWAGNIIPAGNAVYSLGNATNQWKDLWVSNNTIYINSVPIGLNASNVLTVNGSDVVVTSGAGQSTIGNLFINGTMISIAGDAILSETGISISPDVESLAYLQIPNNATADTADVRLHNDAGNVEIGTGSGIYNWYFDNTGNLILPEGTPSINYANGQPYSGGANIGNLEVTGTTIGIANGAPETTIVVGGTTTAAVEVDTNTGAPKIGIYAQSTDFQSYSQGGGDFSSAEWITSEGGGQINLYGVQSYVDTFINTLGGYANVSLEINGTETVPYNGASSGGGTVVLFTTQAPATDPTAVTQIGFILRFNNGILLDPDEGDMLLEIGDFNLNITSQRDINITSSDDLRLRGNDFVGLIGNNSVTIEADSSNAAITWNFNPDGSLSFPSGANITNGALNGGTASASVALNAFSPDGNTVTIQAQGNTSSAVISIFANSGPVTNNWVFGHATLDPTEPYFYVPGGALITTPNATGNTTGKAIFIEAGSADQSNFYTSAGGDLYLKGGRGATNDGGGGGPGGNVNINAGESADPAGRAGNVNITAGALTNWTFDYNGVLSLASISTGEGTGESARITGSRTVVGGFDAALPYVVEIPGHSTFGNIAWTASSGSIQSAKITFVVQSGGSAFQWEQFDVSVCKLDGANAFVTVSNRIKQNSSIADTQVEAYDGEGGLEVWLNPADGQTVAYVNYQAVEFGLMYD